MALHSNRELMDSLEEAHFLKKEEYVQLLRHMTDQEREVLREKAQRVRQSYYGKKVFTRGLIEFTNHCRNNCLYCGIRRDNAHVRRYRLTEEEILLCAEEGYGLGFRTFVLQGGEDGFFTPERLGRIISRMKDVHGDCAVTLSVGEHPREVYQYWYDCGADRYLLRHETASRSHYEMLHPGEMSFSRRMQCLYDLKEIGYQVGAGFMVGSPGQTLECMGEDLIFLKELNPHMVGIGPFIPQRDTPFGKRAAGTLEQTLLLLSLIRLMLPKVLLPATTALGTIHPRGRELGILAGANVVMPNLSPVSVRDQYLLYDNKICTGEESAQCRGCLAARMDSIGYQIVAERGDYPGSEKRHGGRKWKKYAGI